jgi:uncharacterized protein (TIGR00645 family)
MARTGWIGSPSLPGKSPPLGAMAHVAGRQRLIDGIIRRMSEQQPSPPPSPAATHPVERALEQVIFQSRWLLAPIYVGLVVVLLALVVAFFRELGHSMVHLWSMTGQQAIMLSLSLIDLSLAGSLLVIVIFSGYENFVSRIDAAGAEDRLSWMGTVDFSALKLKLFATIVAISAIALLRAFLALGEGEAVSDRQLGWLVGIHLVFVVSGLLMALTDRLKADRGGH